MVRGEGMNEWFIRCPACNGKAPWKEPSCTVTVQVEPAPNVRFVEQHTFKILPMDPVGPHDCPHGKPCGVGQPMCPKCSANLANSMRLPRPHTTCDTCLAIQTKSEQNGEFQHMPGGHCPLIKRKNLNGWIYIKPPLGGCPMQTNLLPAPWIKIFIKNDKLRDLQEKTRLMAYGKKGIP